jgi:hypothetical protein
LTFNIFSGLKDIFAKEEDINFTHVGVPFERGGFRNDYRRVEK